MSWLHAYTQTALHTKSAVPMTSPILSPLRPGQRWAIEALIGGGQARTYPEAARIAGMAEGTLLTHVNRVRQRHPRLYEEIRAVRRAQLDVRHEVALENARAHSSLYFRKQNRYMRQLGISPWG